VKEFIVSRRLASSPFRFPSQINKPNNQKNHLKLLLSIFFAVPARYYSPMI
jgi:hypothetical protein